MSQRDDPGNTENPSGEGYQPQTRQELYDRIRETSKADVIKKEMLRYGFWWKKEDIPSAEPAEAERMKEIRSELGKIREDLAKLHDVDRLIADARKKRMEESRARQKETRERRIREREERKAAWIEAKKKNITYLGEGHSAGLNGQEANAERLAAEGLPIFASALELATAMGIEVGELRFLTYHRKVSAVSHYQRFHIPKKTGGQRLISAPMPRLKSAQTWVLQNILDKVRVNEAAHGFRAGRSIVSNATPHVGAELVVNVDLKDFFPSITYRRACGAFKMLGYSEQIATILALLCTEPEITTVELNGSVRHVARSERHLPQGGPTSPALTNIICRRLDARLTGLAARLGFTYTRYADDLTFSGAGDARVQSLMKALRGIVADEDFRIHPDKTRICRKGNRQEVTGIVVNEKLSVERNTLKRFRATLHQIERYGPAGKLWGDPGANLFDSIQGYANFVFMVDPAKGVKYLAQVKRIRELHDPARKG